MSIWNFLFVAVAIYLFLNLLKGGFKPRFPSDDLITGGQPRQKDIELLKSQGCTTIINMRGAHEGTGFDEKAFVEALGLSYHHLPVAGTEDINFNVAKKLHEILKKSKGKTLIHCASGNRVGAVLALYAHKHMKMNADDAMTFGRKAGLGILASFVRTQLRLS